METRCLIEIDKRISEDSFGQYRRFVQYHLENKLNVIKFFDIIITNALNKKSKMWDAILNSSQIWLNTCFIGDSGRLLVEFLNLAIKENIRDKKVINIREWRDLSWHIPEEAITLIKTLEENNNIQFIYADDNEYFDYIQTALNEKNRN